MSETTIPTFACTSWDGDHLVLHIALPFHQPQPPRGSIAWGATKCGRALRINGSHPNAEETCEECWDED